MVGEPGWGDPYDCSVCIVIEIPQNKHYNTESVVFFKNILEKYRIFSIVASRILMNILIVVILILILLYLLAYVVLSWNIRAIEKPLVSLFIQKVGKIPALIEVMRPYTEQREAFQHIIRLHTTAMVQETESLYDILGLNAKIQNDFHFLMELSVHMPRLQKDEYFLYIRDFIIAYEKMMYARFSELNRMIRYWNIFVQVKNMTGIGLILPGSMRAQVR